MAKRDPLVLAEPESGAVGTAVRDQTGQAFDRAGSDGPALQIDDTRDTAHESDTSRRNKSRRDAQQIAPASLSVRPNAGDRNNNRQDRRR